MAKIVVNKDLPEDRWVPGLDELDGMIGTYDELIDALELIPWFWESYDLVPWGLGWAVFSGEDIAKGITDGRLRLLDIVEHRSP